MKLDPGRFFGQTLLQCRDGGLTINLSRYPPGREQPWHVHTNPTLFVPLVGQHCDQVRAGASDQIELSLLFHPTCEHHASVVGRGGMLGLNLELEPEWLERHALTESDLGGYRLLGPSVWSQLTVLRLVCLALQPVADVWAQRHAHALELLEPVVKPGAPGALPRCPRWLLRGEDYLHHELRSSISLRDVAREAGVHPVYFARVFRRRHGCPVSAYLRALRLVEAGRLVLREGQSLAEAALTVGFADQAHLTRCFSRQFGFSPRAMRRAGDFLRS
jgi:AraC family transcriptional regulator